MRDRRDDSEPERGEGVGIGTGISMDSGTCSARSPGTVADVDRVGTNRLAEAAAAERAETASGM